MKRLIPLLSLWIVVLSVCGPGSPTATASTPVPVASQPTAPASTSAPTPAGPGFTFLGVLNRDAAQAAQSPSVVTGTTNADTLPTLWAAWAENTPGNVRQIFVSEEVAGAFQPRGASLNIHANVVADFPAITFAGRKSPGTLGNLVGAQSGIQERDADLRQPVQCCHGSLAAGRAGSRRRRSQPEPAHGAGGSESFHILRIGDPRRGADSVGHVGGIIEQLFLHPNLCGKGRER